MTRLCLNRATLRILGRVVFKIRGRGFPVQACLAVQKCVFLDGAAGHVARRGRRAIAVAVGDAGLSNGRGRGDVRDLFGVGVLAADLCDADVTSFARLGEGVVAAVKVLALLQIAVRRRDSEIGGIGAKEVRRTLSLFWRRSFLLGSLP